MTDSKNRQVMERGRPRHLRTSLGSVATVAAFATAAVGLSAGGAGATTVRTSASAATAATPKLTATISKQGALSLAGPHTFRAGRVDLSLKSSLKNPNSDASIEVASFKKGYTFADFKADIGTLGASYGENGPSPAGIKALDRAVAHANVYGGLISDTGQTETGSIVLPKAGTYYIWNDTEIPTQPTTLVVTGPEVVRASPHSSATVTATTAKRFGGPKTLPAKGTLTFKNTATNSPHELDLIHVKTGTTQAQVLASLMSSSNSEPAFIRPGEIQTDAVGPGHAVTLSYSLPKGEYVEACFFPDLQTGIPHAFMGMVNIVHLK